MGEGTTFVGLDVHKDSISVAMLQPGESEAVEWQVVHNVASIRRLVRKLQRTGRGALETCYEAGPCGYAVQRVIRDLGEVCTVVAPSLIPRKPGERVKTDRRDARKLAELLRAGLLTEVHPPTESDEAVRDLCRAREAEHENLVRGRHRVSKLLLRHGWSWTSGKKTWGQAHRLWLRSIRFEYEEVQWVLEDYLLALEQVEERLRGLEARIEQVSHGPRYANAVGALRCFRGIDTLTAMSLVAELHDFMRFDSPRHLMAYLGLVHLRALLGRQGAPRWHHQDGESTRSPTTHRGSVALPTSPWSRESPEEARRPTHPGDRSR